MTLIAYDIADPKRLGKVSRLLKKYGLRAQNSIFELETNPADLAKIQSAISEIIEDEEDKVFIYKISTKKKKAKRRGKRKNLWEMIF